jgi:GNAT superfamily N-acetyltransferase
LRAAAPEEFAELMRIERFDPRSNSGALRACHQMHEASEAHDDPGLPTMSLEAFSNWWADGFTGNPQQTWLATAASGPVGCYLLELPDRDNTTLGSFLPVVAPALRRRGIGTALLAHCGEQARQAGRKLLASQALAGSPGEAFARAAGGHPGLTDVRRILAADAGLGTRLAALRAQAEAAAAGYALISWSGPVPGEHLEQVARVVSALSDAPHDDTVEAGSWDAARIRENGERTAAHGLRQYSVAARRADSGEIAALSQALLEPATPGWAFQQITVVARQDRGHRLGLLVKVALHQWLLRIDPGIRHVMTWNGEANEHMVAINELMGYRAGGRSLAWTLPVADLLAPGAAGPG